MSNGVTQFLQFEDTGSFATPDSLPQQLERHIQRDIIRLRLAPGTKLIEEDLCRTYGVSRSPIREALSGIEAGGLASRRPRRGVYVTPMTVRNLDELYDCRVWLEGRAAFHATANRTDEQLASMRDLLKQMEDARLRADGERMFEANVELTDILHQASDSQVLQSQLAQLDRQALRYRYYCYLKDPQIVEDDLQANARLVDQIAAGDSEAAQATTQTLVHHSWGVVRAVLQSHDPEGLPAEPARGGTAHELQ